MDIKESKEKRVKLNRDIENLITLFEQETSVYLNSISIERIESKSYLINGMLIDPYKQINTEIKI